MNLIELIAIINEALARGCEVRANNDYATHSTTFTADAETCAVIVETIIYPCFLNCTKKGTPCRITDIKETGGFGADGWENVRSFEIVMSDEYNSHDYELEGPDEYYASDRYFEDAYEASHPFEY